MVLCLGRGVCGKNSRSVWEVESAALFQLDGVRRHAGRPAGGRSRPRSQQGSDEVFPGRVSSKPLTREFPARLRLPLPGQSLVEAGVEAGVGVPPARSPWASVDDCTQAPPPQPRHSEYPPSCPAPGSVCSGARTGGGHTCAQTARVAKAARAAGDSGACSPGSLRRGRQEETCGSRARVRAFSVGTGSFSFPLGLWASPPSATFACLWATPYDLLALRALLPKSAIPGPGDGVPGRAPSFLFPG